MVVKVTVTVSLSEADDATVATQFDYHSACNLTYDISFFTMVDELGFFTHILEMT